MRPFRLPLFAFAFAVCAGDVRSDFTDLSGSETPAFSAAVAQWLGGDDLVALGNLAAMSEEGNHAAQILLASIASRAMFHFHVTSDLARADRIALLRMPGGLSGKSWLIAAQDAEPLATALLQVSKIGEKAAPILALLDAGEWQTALLAAQAMLLNGEAAELIEIFETVGLELPEEAYPLVAWAYFQADQGTGKYAGSARMASTLLDAEGVQARELEWTTVSPTDVISQNETFDAVVGLVDQVESWTPIRHFCEQNCPDSATNCSVLGASLLSGLSGPFAMRSPLMSVIPNDTYWSSPRVTGDLARVFPDISQLNVPVFASFDACLIESMKEAQTIHRAGQ